MGVGGGVGGVGVGGGVGGFGVSGFGVGGFGVGGFVVGGFGVSGNAQGASWGASNMMIGAPIGSGPHPQRAGLS